MRFPIAVDSPPGTIRPSSPSRSSTERTSTGSTPSFLRISTCSRKSPWSARTPIFFGPSGSRSVFRAVTLRGPVSPLPTTRRELLPFRKVSHLPADHRLAQALARLGDSLRVREVSSGLYYSLRSAGRVPTLEDATPDEDAVGPELHHQGGVGRCCYSAGSEQHDR